uniref:Helicase-associated domain-containing protein n=1 Tax=Heterosigma akashiwo TaxID=2829 RepID=A0A6V2SQE4_HETAK|mmetsp:Transcript_2868/g.4910  ORF Transcript_2868/g.4910 Transcript_2868/m.4910 type:complete len:280 (+) Transcript_2868:95-934(+)
MEIFKGLACILMLCIMDLGRSYLFRSENVRQAQIFVPSRRNKMLAGLQIPPKHAGFLGILAHAPESQLFSDGEATWNQNYEFLLAFQDKHGHVDVPLKTFWGEAKIDLGKWVYLQRRLKNENILSLDRVDRLNAVKFTWDLNTEEASWDDMVAKLSAYANEFGDCFVPKKYAPDPVLGLWVSEQRTAKRERRLNQDQVQELEKIGFSWQPQNSCGSAFMIGLRKLEEFRDTFDHVNVPSDFEDEDLVKYVAAQRLAKAKGKLSDKRIGYLDGMGFDWEG